MEVNISYISQDGPIYPFNISAILNKNIACHYYPVDETVLENSNILIFQYVHNNYELNEHISTIRRRFRFKPVIIITDQLDPSCLSWSIENGITDVIVLPREIEYIRNLLSNNSSIDRLQDFLNNYHDARTANNCNWRTDTLFNNKQCKTRQAINYIHQHYRNKISIETLSSICNMSASTFNRVFKHENGMTFSSYLKAIRIYVAKRLLHGTEMPICEIAYKCGFYDAAYFSRLFRIAEQKTPREYRSQIN